MIEKTELRNYELMNFRALNLHSNLRDIVIVATAAEKNSTITYVHYLKKPPGASQPLLCHLSYRNAYKKVRVIQ